MNSTAEAAHHPGSRHWIDAAAMKRGAAKKPSRRQRQTNQHAVSAQGFCGIVRTRGIVPTRAGRAKDRGNRRRDRLLIKPQEAKQGPGGHFPNQSPHPNAGSLSQGAPCRQIRRDRVIKHKEGGNLAFHETGGKIRRQASTNFCSIWRYSSRFTAFRATRSRSHSGGTSCWFWRKIARSLRLARLRRTALPTAAAEATTPTRGPTNGSSGCLISPTSCAASAG